MKKVIIAALCLGLLFQGCSDFDDLNTNPNATEKVTSGLLATGLILNITQLTGGGKTFTNHAMMSKHMAWGEKMETLQYNYIARTEFKEYITLIDAQKMADLASGIDKDAYTGLALFIKAYKLFYLSLSLGDIPYSDAMNGETGNMTPKYDTQKEVMVQVLADLDTAEKSFAAATVNFTGDPLFGGKVSLWRKFTNSFRLKVLMYLSNKTNESDLKIAATFADIVSNKPLIASNSENMQLVYSNKAGQIYPFNSTVNNFHYYPIMTTTIIDNLKQLGDYRLFYYANPSKYSLETLGKAENDWDAYPGIDPSAPFDEIAKDFTANKHCGFNNRYTGYEPGEPLMRLSFAEQNFIIAEGIIRGWVSGSAKEYYEQGIRAAMQFITSNTPADIKYHHGRPITDEYIAEYLASNPVSFASSSDTQLKQIWMQKYILYFMQHPWEAYYEHRRTSYPEWPVNPSTNQNSENPTGIPNRWLYPQKEYDTNMDNLKAALDRQYSGQDKINDLMWILK